MKLINKLMSLVLLMTCQIVWAQDEQQTQQPIEPALPVVDEGKAQVDLTSAYKKEYAFLSSQVKNIKARTKEFTQQAKNNKNIIDQEILLLESNLLALETQADQLADDIFDIQRISESSEDNEGLLKATIQQGQSTVSEFNKDINALIESKETDIDKISELINELIAVIKNNSSMIQTQGSYYLDDGTEVQGQILKIGNIAKYGKSDKGSGVLAPAGENTFKVWKDAENAMVENVFAFDHSNSLPIFLYESSLKAVEEKQQKTVKSVIDSGGIIAWIIATLGLFALLLILLRIWFLKKASASTDKLLNAVVDKIEQKDLNAAVRISSSKNSSSARVLSAALRNLDRDRDHIEDIVSEAILHESSVLNRFGSLIMVVATVAPLLGLLGTVTGMISTFDIITEFGTGDPKMLSSGISVALVTTEIGLIVAIPALMFGNILAGWAERIKSDMEKAALRAINVYQKVI